MSIVSFVLHGEKVVPLYDMICQAPFLRGIINKYFSVFLLYFLARVVLEVDCAVV